MYEPVSTEVSINFLNDNRWPACRCAPQKLRRQRQNDWLKFAPTLTYRFRTAAARGWSIWRQAVWGRALGRKRQDAFHLPPLKGPSNGRPYVAHAHGPRGRKSA